MMKYNIPSIIIVSFLAILFCGSCRNNNEIKHRPEATFIQNINSIYKIKVNTIDGIPFDLSTLKEKKILIVNTASKCGYVSQYEELQQLSIQEGNSLVILGFPCNDFGDQEPGTEKEIADFCTKNYNVTFQMFEKIHVKGNEQHALYKWLTSPELNGWNKESPSWNFCKYLISENGELLNYFGSSIKPMNTIVIDALKNKKK